MREHLAIAFTIQYNRYEDHRQAINQPNNKAPFSQDRSIIAPSRQIHNQSLVLPVVSYVPLCHTRHFYPQSVSTVPKVLRNKHGGFFADQQSRAVSVAAGVVRADG